MLQRGPEIQMGVSAGRGRRSSYSLDGCNRHVTLASDWDVGVGLASGCDLLRTTGTRSCYIPTSVLYLVVLHFKSAFVYYVFSRLRCLCTNAAQAHMTYRAAQHACYGSGRVYNVRGRGRPGCSGAGPRVRGGCGGGRVGEERVGAIFAATFEALLCGATLRAAHARLRSP